MILISMPGLSLLLALMAPALHAAPPSGLCVVAEAPPEYYNIVLVPTRKVPGTRQAAGVATVSFAPSPFGIALTPDGRYVYDLAVAVEKLQPPKAGAYVVWVSTPDLDRVVRLGVLDAQGRTAGQVSFNKYLVFITLEPTDAPGDRWTGPVILRGISKSGFMHTMAGHGPFQQEPCANFGFN